MVSRSVRRRRAGNSALSMINRGFMQAAPAYMGPVTPARRAGRARRRRQRRLRERESVRIVNGLIDPNVGGIPGMAAPVPFQMSAAGEPALNENYVPSSVEMTRGGNFPLPPGMLGTTETGAAWAVKALHPMSEEVTRAVGIPDHTHVPVATPEFRSNQTIGTVGTGSDGTDDVDIMQLPVPGFAFFYRRYKSGAELDIGQGWTGVPYNAFKVGKGVLTYTGTEDSVVPNPIPVTRRIQIAGANLDPYDRVRQMYSGITCHLDAPALADQGRVIAGQLPVEGNMTTKVYNNGEEYDPTKKEWNTKAGYDYLPTQSLGFLPMEEGNLFEATPGAIVLEAREGAYIPVRFSEPVHNFVTGASFETIHSSATIVSLVGKADPGEEDLRSEVFYYNFEGNDAKYALACNDMFNTLKAVVLFRGISGVANVQVKCRSGYETQVGYANAVSPFQHMSPCLDRKAIDVVTEVAQKTPMAYPSSYNDFSDIFKTIGGVINAGKQVLGVGKGIVKALGGSGIPIVSDIGNVIGGIADSLGLAPTYPGGRVRRPNVRRTLMNL